MEAHRMLGHIAPNAILNAVKRDAFTGLDIDVDAPIEDQVIHVRLRWVIWSTVTCGAQLRRLDEGDGVTSSPSLTITPVMLCSFC